MTRASHRAAVLETGMFKISIDSAEEGLERAVPVFAEKQFPPKAKSGQYNFPVQKKKGGSPRISEFTGTAASLKLQGQAAG